MLLAILTMHLLDTVRITATSLTVLSLLLLSGAVLLRISSSAHLSRLEDFRKRALPHLNAYLGEQEGIEPVLSILGKARAFSLDLLMGQAMTGDDSIRERLHPLFKGLSFLPREILHIGSRDWSERLSAAERLSYFGDEEAIPPLMNGLGDEILDVRLAAALSLCRLGCEGAVEPIISSLDVSGEISQRRIAEILSILGHKALQPLTLILKDPARQATALCIAARTAGLLRLGSLSGHLEDLLSHPDPEVRLNAVRTLGSLGQHSSATPVAKLAEDSSWEVRNAVTEALGRLRDPSALPLLIRALGDPEWWVRYHAATSLISLGEPGTSALRDASQNHPDAYGRDMSLTLIQQHDFETSSKEQLP